MVINKCLIHLIFLLLLLCNVFCLTAFKKINKDLVEKSQEKLDVQDSFQLMSSRSKRVHEQNVSNQKPTKVKIVKLENNWRPDGYDFKVETSDKFAKNEYATLDGLGTLKINGDYFIKYPNGQLLLNRYYAGTNGFVSKISFGFPAGTTRLAGIAQASLIGGGLG